MFSHLYDPKDQSPLPFSTYIDRCRNFIAERRTDIPTNEVERKTLIEANIPFELAPASKPKIGVLLIHGLLNSPSAMKDIASHLQASGILSRAILLPGHGTTPNDLLHISYQDWVQAVQYGIDSLKQDVDQIYLAGYSTGATLAVYHALQDPAIAGLILLAPAIRIKAPIDFIVGWKRFIKLVSKNRKWAHQAKEIDYAKYQSIPFNAVRQVSELTTLIKKISKEKTITCPIYMALSQEDETVSCETAINFFSNLSHPNSKLLLYASRQKTYQDMRIEIRPTKNDSLAIKHFSHLSILFSSNNPHYGLKGDYLYISNHENENVIYGAYNSIAQDAYQFLFDMGLLKQKRQELTYNPDFDYMVKEISDFINASANAKLTSTRQS